MSDTSLSPTNQGWSSSASGPSGRKGSRKVRTGCITCKIRKVKCDEARPSCLRCVKTGRKCDGYPAVKPRASRVNRSPSPIALLETAEELRAFDYYRRKSSAVLGGITMDHEEFWGGLVVKLTATEPAVRHAVLALSSLHEKVSAGNDLAGKKAISANDFAFGEYGKAIAAVRNWDMNNHGSQPAAIPLLVCVLFVCIEFLMDYDAAAQLHICQGRLILSKMAQADNSSPAMEMVRKVLVPIYARLGLASSLFGSRPSQIPQHLTWSQGDVPMVLESMKDARNTLYHLIDAGLLFTQSAKPAAYNPETELWQLQMLKAQQDELLGQLAKWKAAFTVLKAAQVTETIASKAMQDLLYVYWHASKIWISTALSTAETAFDDHEDSFAAIVSYASSSLAGSGSLCKEDAAFTFETETLAPVYWTATKCRHPLLRRAAVRLLNREEMKRRRENLWRGEELVVISSHVIEVEEGTKLDLDSVSDETMLAEAKGYWHSDVELRVPVTHPPSLKKPTTDFSDDQLSHVLVGGTSLENQSAASPSSLTPRSQTAEPEPSPHIDPAMLQAPYGVPESQRVKNALIGPTKDNGVWLTTFSDPLPGNTEWEVKKVFLKVYPQ